MKENCKNGRIRRRKSVMMEGLREGGWKGYKKEN